MADRQQNINIKFNTNAVDLEKANQLLTKAKAANDALNASINKTGTQGAADVKRFSSTIEGLRLQMAQLKGQIDLTNQSDKTRLEQLRGQYAAMSTQLKQYQGEVAKTAAGQKSLVDGLGGLYTAVRLALTAGLIRETVQASLEMAKLKGTVEGVTRAFQTLPNATLLMADLKAKTHGTLDELTLMQKAVQAKNFKIPLEQLGTLLEFAAIKAQQTGLDINYLVNSLITGLGRNSIRLLDNLQISVTELRQKTKELGSTQAAVFAIVNKQMQDMGGFLETDATKVDQLAASWTNFKIIVSDSNFWGFVVRQLNNAVEGAIMLFSSAEANQKRFALQFATNRAQQFTAGKPTFGGTQTELDNEKQQVIERRQNIELMKKEADALSGQYGDAQKRQKLIIEQVGVMQQRNSVSLEYIRILEEYQLSLSKLVKPEEEQLGLIEGWNAQIKDINEQIEQSTDVTGKEQKALTLKRKELERLIKVYSDFDDEMKHTELTSKSLREEIDKQIEAITEKLAKALKPPAKGGVPAGGFQGPMGPAGGAQGDPNSSTALLNTWYNNYASFWDKIKMGFDDMNTHIRKGGEQTVEDQRRSLAQAVRDLVNAVSTSLNELAANAISADVRSYDERIAASEAYYNKQVDLLGDNQKAKVLLEKKHNQEITRLERERAEAAKRAALSTIVIQTAVAVVKALATAPNYIVGIIEAAAAGVLGAAQYSVAASAKYAQGVIDLKGPGTETSDSIPARLSKGESVMTAQETRESMGILKAIRAKKINDGIISEIFAKSGGAQQGYDFTRLEKAIHEMPKPSDLIKQGSMIYEAKEKAKGHRQLVRNKYLG